MRSIASQQSHPPEATGRGPRVHPGFSLPELMVVLFVVSLMAYMVAPRIEIVRFRMDGAARGGVAALVSAQRLAVKRQHDVAVVMDTVNERLLIHEDRNNDGQVDSGEKVRPVVFEEGVSFGLGSAPPMADDASAVTFEEVRGDLPGVRFIRNGSASEEGAFYLTSGRAREDGEHAADTRALRIDRPTGRVTWFAYDPPEWVEGS